MSGESPGGTLPASLAKSAIALRSATPADAEFCCRLHKAAMGDYITATWGWDEQVQPAFHDRAFNPHRWQIITAGQASIGMLDIDYRRGEIYLSRIETGPSHQRLGIGNRIIRALLEEAERTGQDPLPFTSRTSVPECPILAFCCGWVTIKAGVAMRP